MTTAVGSSTTKGASALATGNDFFCKIVRGEIPGRKLVTENETTFGTLDGYPVGRGHTLIVPKRHVASFFETTEQERDDIFRGLFEARQVIERQLEKHEYPKPDGYNIGINDGRAAGRTVDHLHVHLIPRYDGDMKDPKGGVRGVIPERQSYSGPPDESVNDLLL